MTDDSFIDSMIDKLEKAKQADDPDTRKTKLREVMIHTEMEVKDKKFSTLLREEMKKQEPSVTIQKLKDRADHLEESLDLWSEHGEEPYLGIYSDQGLQMMRYEISRLEKLKERGRI